MSRFTATSADAVFGSDAPFGAETVIGVPAAVVWASPASPRPVDAPAIADVPALGAWTAALSDDDRLGLIGRVETQALLGEPVDIVDRAGEWTNIRLPAQPSSKDAVGYPGWVRTAHLTPRVQAPEDVELVVVRGLRSVPATVSDGSRQTLSAGTILPRLAPSEPRPEKQTTLMLPDGRTAQVPGATVAPVDAPAPAETALTLARTFAGSPYLWAGMSSVGVDCSGLVHLSYRGAGLVVPRDADDQELAAPALPPTAARAGDPVFFANERGVHHVALSLGSGSGMFHAPRTGRPVADGSWADAASAGERVTAARFV